MNNVSKSRSMALLGSLLLALSLDAIAAPVSSFTWYNDSRSTLDYSQVAPIRSGNSVTFTNFQAVNKSNQALSDVGVITPWLFTRIDGTIYSLDWSNAQNGWVNPNVGGTSLLVSLDTPSERLRFGDIANFSGQVGLQPTEKTPGKYGENVSETRRASDRIPFLDLGSFGAKEAKTFDLAFTYHFGDNRDLQGLVPFTIGVSYTVEPLGSGSSALALPESMASNISPASFSSSVPEPGSLALLGLGLFGFLARRTTDRSPKSNRSPALG